MAVREPLAWLVLMRHNANINRVFSMRIYILLSVFIQKKILYLRCAVEKLVSRGAHNSKAAGSNPACATIHSKRGHPME